MSVEWVPEPRYWRWQANSLRHSADVLFEDLVRTMAEARHLRSIGRDSLAEEVVKRSSNEFGPYQSVALFLLIGLAVENLLKGIIVSRKSMSREEMRNSWGGSKGHDLVRLMADAGISASDDEKLLLKQLTEQVEWAARYPVSFDPNRKEDIAFRPAEFEELYRRLIEAFDSAEKASRGASAGSV